MAFEIYLDDSCNNNINTMIITVTRGTQNFDINTQSLIPFDELIKIITEKFGEIPNLHFSIYYHLNHKTLFVVDDDTFSRAMSSAKDRLHLLIVVDKEEIDTKQYHKEGYRRFSQIKVVDEGWNKQQWVRKICESSHKLQSAKKLNSSSKKPSPCSSSLLPLPINSSTLREIETKAPKVQRFGHSQSLIGSFIMSCYHQEARNKKIEDSNLCTSLWKLDRWREEKAKALAKKEKREGQLVPVLSLSSHKREQFKAIQKPSVLFSEPTGQDPQAHSRISESGVGLQQQAKYYIWDQLQVHLTKISAGQIKQQELSQFISSQPITRQFTDTDLKFVTNVFDAFVQYSLRGNYYLQPNLQEEKSGMLLQFEDDETVAILGDWGTGENDANGLLEEVVLRYKATIVLHLGDVYYAGFPEEFERVSNKIRELQGVVPNLRYYTIPGNHDYYTFGQPFHDHLANNHKEAKYLQQKSFFCLRNKSSTVQFIGLNTALNQHSITGPVDLFFDGTALHEKEVQWAIKKVNQFPGKTILLTHHMLFSSFQSILGSLSEVGQTNPHINTRLASQLFEVFPKLTLWVWGHQHRFSTYIPNAFGVNRSILFGNSAFQNNEEDYYSVKYSPDIVDARFHPKREKDGYYCHTAVLLNKFKDYTIQARYIYMTSSFKKTPFNVREQSELIAQPRQLDITYNTTFQIIQQSGLSISFASNLVYLSSEPANLQFIDTTNPNTEGNINVDNTVLIRIACTPFYLFVGSEGFIEAGEYSTAKHKYYWKIRKQNQQKSPMQTGDIFFLENMWSVRSIGREANLTYMQLKESLIPSKFFIYKRQTNGNLYKPPVKKPACCGCF